MEKSRSAALSDAHVLGAKNWTRRSEGRELEDRVAVVVGAAARGHRTVSGAHPYIAGTVDHGCGAAHPDGALVFAGAAVDLERP